MSGSTKEPPVIVIESADDSSTDPPMNDHRNADADISSGGEQNLNINTNNSGSNTSPKLAQKSEKDKLPASASVSSLSVPTLSPNGSAKERKRHTSKEEELKHLTEDVRSFFPAPIYFIRFWN